MQNIKISVVVPVFNAEITIEKSLNSVLQQTLSNLEIICIDNNSTDKSIERIKKLQAQDSRIKLLHEKEQGAGPARNKGLYNATGEYVFFLDPDDSIYNKNTLKGLYKIAKKENLNIVGGSAFIVDKDTGSQIDGDKRYYFDKDGLVKYRDYQFDWGFWRFIYRRGFLEDNNIKFPAYLRGQDTVFFVKAMISAGKFYAIRDMVYRYNYSFSSEKHSPRTYQDYEKANKEVIKIAKSNKLKNLEKIAQSHRVPLVSVIVPVYNTKKEILISTLQDIKNQTYQNTEVIVVNDGSNKRITHFLDRLGREYGWRVVHQPNKGLSSARNVGYKMSSGEYIQFLDSDDSFGNRLIELAVSKALSSNADIVIENFRINKAGIIGGGILSPDTLPSGESFALRDVGSSCRLHTFPYNVWAKMFKREFLEEHDILHDEDLHRAEDVLFSSTALIFAKRISFLPDVYIEYREDIPNSNSVTNDKYPIDSVVAWERLYDLLIEIGLLDVYKKDFELAMSISVWWHITKMNTEIGRRKLATVTAKFMKKINFSSYDDNSLLITLTATNPDYVALVLKKEQEMLSLANELLIANQKLSSFLSIKRSFRLLLGNIKRRIRR